MPDFVAALTASAVFCLGLVALNGLTRWGLPPAPVEEGSALQLAGAALLARLAWRRSIGRG